MSNRTYVCLNCKKSYRRARTDDTVLCPICHGACEFVNWKIRIPSPKRERQWRLFWEKYLAEKELLRQFHDDPNVKEIELDILNQRWVKR